MIDTHPPPYLPHTAPTNTRRHDDEADIGERHKRKADREHLYLPRTAALCAVSTSRLADVVVTRKCEGAILNPAPYHNISTISPSIYLSIQGRPSSSRRTFDGRWGTSCRAIGLSSGCKPCACTL